MSGVRYSIQFSVFLVQNSVSCFDPSSQRRGSVDYHELLHLEEDFPVADNSVSDEKQTSKTGKIYL